MFMGAEAPAEVEAPAPVTSTVPTILSTDDDLVTAPPEAAHAE